MGMNYPLILSLHEMASLLKVSARWLRQEVAANRIPYLQAGRRRLFNAHAVQKAIADRAAEGVRLHGNHAAPSVGTYPAAIGTPAIDNRRAGEVQE